MSDQSIIHIALTYLVVINVVVFFVYGIDKWKAKKSKWRVPEAKRDECCLGRPVGYA